MEIEVVENCRRKKDRITLRIVSSDGKEVKYSVKPDILLGKLIKFYCDSHFIDQSKMIFLCNAQKITETSTPLSLNMKNGDYIDTVQNYYSNKSYFKE